MLDAGEDRFVAAGGDGTVNLLVDALMSRQAPASVTVGAVGLGSSNDFHKPFGLRVDGVPLRLDFQAANPWDVCTLEVDAAEPRHWLINASVGLTADANQFFNNGDRILRTLKRVSAGAAIAYAAARTLAINRTRRMRVAIDCAPAFDALVTNLGIVKNPNFSGTFTYGSRFEPDSGYFFVHLCEAMSRVRVLETLWRSRREGFEGLPSTRSWRARHLVVTATHEFPVEFDGEVVSAHQATFSERREAIRICG
jgi:diacylglycerol kinase family enzyme